MVNIDLIKKIRDFLKISKSLKYLDPYIFENIDKYKEFNGIDFEDYYLEYINNLPKIDFENVVKISREVYQLCGKEKDFDEILKHLMMNHSTDVGSLNKDDDNFIARANEDRVLLSGTYYDIILLCHEIGHKLRYNDFIKVDNIMNNFLFETPSIIIEIFANNYLRDKYNIDLNVEKLRKVHVLSEGKEDNIEKYIFLIITRLMKNGKLNIINIYQEFIKDENIVQYLSNQENSIIECVADGISDYSYGIGFILGSYINDSDKKIELLDMFLKYKNNGISMPFTIEESIIKESLRNKNYTTK